MKQDIIFLNMRIPLRLQIFDAIIGLSICVDEQTPQFSFVTIHGTARLGRLKCNELLKLNPRIAERYMDKSNAKTFGNIVLKVLFLYVCSLGK
jgi:hypothetical protein